MKKTHNKLTKYIAASSALVIMLLAGGCTKLDETLYDRVTSESFLQTKADVTRDFLRPFEHSSCSIKVDPPCMLQ